MKTHLSFYNIEETFSHGVCCINCAFLCMKVCTHHLNTVMRIQHVCLCVRSSVCIWPGWVCLTSCLEGKPDPKWPRVSPAAPGSEKPTPSTKRSARQSRAQFTLHFQFFLFRLFWCKSWKASNVLEHQITNLKMVLWENSGIHLWKLHLSIESFWHVESCG